MKENDLLTKLIEKSVSNNAPIVVKDNSGNFLGAISQKDLLTSVDRVDRQQSLEPLDLRQ